MVSKGVQAPLSNMRTEYLPQDKSERETTTQMTKNLQQNIQTAELSDLMDMVCKEMKNDPEGFEEMKVDHHTPVGSKSKISFKNIKNYQNYSVLNKW